LSIKESKELRSSWLEHPYTVVLRSDARAQVSAAMSHLREVCKTSADPEVGKAYGRLQSAEIWEKIFLGKIGGT
jgi:hypothetical protein